MAYVPRGVLVVGHPTSRPVDTIQCCVPAGDITLRTTGNESESARSTESGLGPAISELSTKVQSESLKLSDALTGSTAGKASRLFRESCGCIYGLSAAPAG